MPRCDYDVIFYRVFCITLLGIAFTFTVILTNVFVDIDGLLYSEKVKSPKILEEKTPMPQRANLPTNDLQENGQETFNQLNQELTPMYHYDKQYDENENNLDRSKRSLDTKKYKLNVKNPRVKMMITKKLSSLLEDLEDEESTTVFETTISDNSYSSNNLNALKLKEIDKVEREGVLHLTMHNILLKGIINHMDLNDIYKTINDLSATGEKNSEKGVTNKPSLEQQLADAEKVENKFLEELANCTRLRKEIMLAKIRNSTKNNINKKASKILINTLIEIKSTNDIPDSVQKKAPKDNVIGVVKLLYNGKSIKFTDANDEIKNSSDDNMINTAKMFKEKHINPQENLDLHKSVVDDYVSKFYKRESNIYPQLSEFLEKRRSKRNAVLKNTEHHKKGHKNPNEFYVEIETRFDKKDMDITKKKQFVKELIKKIQKAIRTKDEPQKTTQKVTHARPRHRIVQFKKRILSPLEDPLVKKLGITADHVVHRHLDPISKVIPMRDNFGPDKIESHSKDAWKEAHDFPSFLSRAKSINSAEVGEVNVEYNKMAEGIPQRLQLPLNNNNNNINDDGQQIDVGNIKLSIKDLDGTGLAIGFNQLLPESDKFVVYDGLENMFEHFPENYEQGDKKETGISDDANEEYANTMVSFHDIIKRSAQFDHQDKSLSQEKVQNSDNKTHNLSPSSLLEFGAMGSQKKQLSVHKYFNHRNNMKVIQYLNTNSLSNRHKKYVSKHKKVAKSKRRRRDLSNIRLLTDILPGDVIPDPDRSQENVFIVSDENIFDENPAEIRRPSIPDKPTTYDKTAIDQYDRLLTPDDYMYRDGRINKHREENREREPAIERDRIRERESENPLHHERELDNPQVFIHEQLQDQTRERYHDPLPELSPYHTQRDLSKNDPNLSNYPHIMSSKADDNLIHNLIFDGPEPEPIEPKINEIKTHILHEPAGMKPPDNIDHLPDLEELTNAIAPKTSYKVTVKLLPKNDSSDGTGVKEVFTTINKTFNKNGLLYSRLVNVSEIAKIQSLNETVPIEYLEANEKEQNQKQQNIVSNNKLKKSETDLNELNQQKQILKDIIDKATENKNVISQVTFQPNNINVNKPPPDFQSIAKRIRDQTKKSVNTPIVAKPAMSKEPAKFETRVTNAILAKIEENTNALRTFLQRLNKLEETPKRHPTFPTSHTFMSMPSPHSIQPTFTMPSIPNIDTHRNGSFIPFVYAFEHPYPTANHTDNNLSVVYHGHIHTKTGPKVKHFDISKLNSQKHSKRNALRSRFFLDDVGTVIGTPMNVYKYKNYIKNPKIKINSTILI